MGAGHRTKRVPHYVRTFPFPTRKSHYVDGNATGAKAWTGECPWEKAGVWRWSESKNQPVALRDDYFRKDASGREVNFYSDFYWPFVRRWDALVASKAPKKARMVEAVPNEFCPEWPLASRPKNFVYAPHWCVLLSPLSSLCRRY